MALATLIPSVVNANKEQNLDVPNSAKALSPIFIRPQSFLISTFTGLLIQLLEGGDSQHLVACCEIFRGADIDSFRIVAKEIGDLRIRESYLSYIDVLMRLQMFSSANGIIKTSWDPYISQLSRQGVIFRSACAKCCKELRVDGDIGISTPKISDSYCSKCKKCVALCVLCVRPVLGMVFIVISYRYMTYFTYLIDFYVSCMW
jgi:hypothetical protein